MESVRFLLRELRQLFPDIGPCLLTFDNTLDRCADSVFVRSHLLGAISISKGECVVLERLEVDSDAEGSTKLVVARIPLTNGCRRVIYSARYA